MSEAKFTKGPWEALFDKRRDNYSIFGGGSKGTRHWIANTKCESTPRDHAANAHLIAAAPELYEALEDVLGLIPLEFEESPMVAFAKAVLAKARGEVL